MEEFDKSFWSYVLFIYTSIRFSFTNLGQNLEHLSEALPNMKTYSLIVA